MPALLIIIPIMFFSRSYCSYWTFAEKRYIAHPNFSESRANRPGYSLNTIPLIIDQSYTSYLLHSISAATCAVINSWNCFGELELRLNLSEGSKNWSDKNKRVEKNKVRGYKYKVFLNIDDKIRFNNIICFVLKSLITMNTVFIFLQSWFFWTWICRHLCPPYSPRYSFRR